jgi:hypothetical protein
MFARLTRQAQAAHHPKRMNRVNADGGYSSTK